MEWKKEINDWIEMYHENTHSHYKFIKTILLLLSNSKFEIIELIPIGSILGEYKNTFDHSVYVPIVYLDKTLELHFPYEENKSSVEISKINDNPFLNFMNLSFTKKNKDNNSTFEQVLLDTINYYINTY